MTGERPVQGVTPDSLLALHAAGYREVRERLGPGTLLDLGCGTGFQSATLLGEGRFVTGVDYDAGTAAAAHERWAGSGLRLVCMDAARLGLAPGSLDWACSSHLIEHFQRPERHVREVATALKETGTAFFITPNRPADFENPFHLVLFERDHLEGVLLGDFEDVTVWGLEGTAAVKEDLALRRAKANRLLALDFLDLRHRVPRSWYVAVYTRALPVAYRMLARGGTGGRSGISDDDFFISDGVDATTPVLFAVARRPRR